MLRTNEFPFLLGRAFIEAARWDPFRRVEPVFPFLFGRAFIEVSPGSVTGPPIWRNFPSFWEGLSLRLDTRTARSRDTPHFPTVL